MSGEFKRREWAPLAASVLGGLLVFGLWGNPTRGYYHTPSLFSWWFLAPVKLESRHISPRMVRFCPACKLRID